MQQVNQTGACKGQGDVVIHDQDLSNCPLNALVTGAGRAAGLVFNGPECLWLLNETRECVQRKGFSKLSKLHRKSTHPKEELELKRSNQPPHDPAESSRVRLSSLNPRESFSCGISGAPRLGSCNFGVARRSTARTTPHRQPSPYFPVSFSLMEKTTEIVL